MAKQPTKKTASKKVANKNRQLRNPLQRKRGNNSAYR